MIERFKILIESPQGKIADERARVRRQDNIKIDLTGTGCGSVVWNELYK
jgi:hypothetical protein